MLTSHLGAYANLVSNLRKRTSRFAEFRLEHSLLDANITRDIVLISRRPSVKASLNSAPESRIDAVAIRADLHADLSLASFDRSPWTKHR